MVELTVSKVQAALAAGVKKANEIGSPSSLAVVDAGRNLLGFIRMDAALLASIEISQGKAYTARSLNMKTGDVTAYVQPGAPFYGMETSHRQAMVVFAGGIPIEIGGTVIGAVGVAGGTLDNDVAVAQTVVDALIA
jgi:uncharacterized protein GlcG (DUF336 family)